MHVLWRLIDFYRENQQRKVMGSLIASEQICMLWSFHIWGKSFYCSWMWLYHLWLVWHSICLTVDLPYWSYSFQESQPSGLIHQLYMVIFRESIERATVTMVAWWWSIISLGVVCTMVGGEQVSCWYFLYFMYWIVSQEKLNQQNKTFRSAGVKTFGHSCVFATNT